MTLRGHLQWWWVVWQLHRRGNPQHWDNSWEAIKLLTGRQTCWRARLCDRLKARGPR